MTHKPTEALQLIVHSTNPKIKADDFCKAFTLVWRLGLKKHRTIYWEVCCEDDADPKIDALIEFIGKTPGDMLKLEWCEKELRTRFNAPKNEKEQKLIQLEQLEQRTKDFETIRTDLENNVNQLTCDVTNKNETIKTLETQVEELQKFKQFEEFKHKFDEISVEYEKEKDRLTKLFRLYEETEAENQHLKKEVSKWETWFNQNEDLFNKLFSSVDTLRKTPSPTSTTQSTPKPQQPKPQQPVNPPSNQQDSGNKKKSKGKLRFKR